MDTGKFIEFRMPIPVTDEVYEMYQNMQSEKHQKWARHDLANFTFTLIMKYVLRKYKDVDGYKECRLSKLVASFIEHNNKDY